MTPRIYGYHCNETNKLIEFKNDKNKLLISYEDGIWLGNGMYFWENNGNAEYWKRGKLRNFPEKTFDIIKVLISLSNLLDLTDIEHIAFCKKIISDLKERGINEFNDNELGRNLNLIFDNTDLLEDFYVLKIHGLYTRWNEDKFLTGKKNYSSNRPTSIVKTIYSIKDPRAIIKVC